MAGIIQGPDISELLSATPTVGLPANTKDRPRIDFVDTDFDRFIEQHGVRLAWSRAAVCPCAPINNQTRQPDLTCNLCSDTPGFLFFRPADYVVDETLLGDLDDVQTRLINQATTPSVVIKGLMQRVGTMERPYDTVGDWIEGRVSVTVRKDNRVGYYDRFIALDQLLAYSEIIYSPAPDTPINLRFPATRVDFVRTQSTLYEKDTHYFLNNVGQLCFQTGAGPTQGEGLSVTYLHRPQFLVTEHLHAFRDTFKNTKLGKAPKTPSGDPQLLPIQMQAQLEFLVGRGSQG